MNIREVSRQTACAEMPKEKIQFIISHRFSMGQHDFLAVTSNPLMPIWIPSHLADSACQPLIQNYFKHHADYSALLFVPHAQF